MLHRLPLLVAGLTAKTPDGRAALTLAPIQFAPRAEVDGDDARSFTILSYRQTEKPACKGGRANANFFRFRHKSMRAIARTFRTKPFITGHDWGDVRARGGTIRDAWASAPSDAADELAFFGRIVATEPWAIDGLESGSIDRFSIGAIGRGEITCTVHGAAVFSACWCWPGRVVVDEDGHKRSVEWEYEDAQGVEKSAVNVPAVDGTGITELEALDVDEQLAAEPSAPPIAAALEQLAELCGRQPDVDAIAELARGTRPTTVQVAATVPEVPETIERVAAAATGVSAGAVVAADSLAASAPVLVELTSLRAQLAAANRELEASRARDREREAELARIHADTALDRLRAAYEVTDAAMTRLRSIAASAGRAAFDAALALVTDAAPRMLAAGAAPRERSRLQSDARPATNDPGPGTATGEIDAYDQHKANPELPRMMKLARLTPDDVRKHGSTTFHVVPNLRELADATARRGG